MVQSKKMASTRKSYRGAVAGVGAAIVLVDDGKTIMIPKDFLEQNKNLFGNWKKS